MCQAHAYFGLLIENATKTPSCNHNSTYPANLTHQEKRSWPKHFMLLKERVAVDKWQVSGDARIRVCLDNPLHLSLASWSRPFCKDNSSCKWPYRYIKLPRFYVATLRSSKVKISKCCQFPKWGWRTDILVNKHVEMTMELLSRWDERVERYCSK